MQAVVEAKGVFHGKGKNSVYSTSDPISNATFRDSFFSMVEETLDNPIDKDCSCFNETVEISGAKDQLTSNICRRKKVCYKNVDSLCGPGKNHLSCPIKKKRPKRKKSYRKGQKIQEEGLHLEGPAHKESSSVFSIYGTDPSVWENN